MDVMNKKAQFKIQQMAFMLMAVVLFFILVALFFVSYYVISLKDTATGTQEEKALILIDNLANSPEFRYDQIRCNDNCIDTDKIMVLKNREAYVGFGGSDNGFWNIAAIEIIRNSPSENKNIVCDLGNYPNCGVYEIYENTNTKKGEYIGGYVNLCRKEKMPDSRRIYDKCELGKLLIAYKEKT